MRLPLPPHHATAAAALYTLKPDSVQKSFQTQKSQVLDWKKDIDSPIYWTLIKILTLLLMLNLKKVMIV